MEDGHGQELKGGAPIGAVEAADSELRNKYRTGQDLLSRVCCALDQRELGYFIRSEWGGEGFFSPKWIVPDKDEEKPKEPLWIVQTVEVHAAPKQAVYDSEVLYSMVATLLPEEEPWNRPFHVGVDHLQMGYVEFRDVVGRATFAYTKEVQIMIADKPETFPVKPSSETRRRTEGLLRQILVYAWPELSVAQKYVGDEDYRYTFQGIYIPKKDFPLLIKADKETN